MHRTFDDSLTPRAAEALADQSIGTHIENAAESQVLLSTPRRTEGELNMVNLLIKHTVKDFANWKKIFDDHAPAREAAGCKGGELFQNAENPNEVLIRFSWDSVDHARAFASSPELQEAMKRAGVLGPPTVTVLGEAQPVAR
jgi:heme-degrading monooxygenase HmoA